MIRIFLFVLLLSPGSGFANPEQCGLVLIEIRGNSLSPLLRDGDHVDAYPRACLSRELRKGDLVVFKNGSSVLPLIKRIVAVPADQFSARSGELNINSHAAKNSVGKDFKFSKRAAGLLNLYEEEFNGVLPKGVYLVMGDEDGVLDSTRFGPVAVEDIDYVTVGPAEVVEKSLRGF